MIHKPPITLLYNNGDYIIIIIRLIVFYLNRIILIICKNAYSPGFNQGRSGRIQLAPGGCKWRCWPAWPSKRQPISCSFHQVGQRHRRYPSEAHTICFCSWWCSTRKKARKFRIRSNHRRGPGPRRGCNSQEIDQRTVWWQRVSHQPSR